MPILSCLRARAHRGLSLLLTVAFCALSPIVGAANAATAAEAPRPAGAIVVALQQPPAPAGGDFVPVDELPAQEQLPAAPLLIAAYAFVWAALLVYVFMLWRRLARVEGELASLSRQVDERRRN